MKLPLALLLSILYVLLATLSHAKNLHKEAVYQRVWCEEMGGQIEYVLPDRTRVDCLLDDYAVEMDFALKFAEAIGQAMFYSEQTGRWPGIVLIMEDPERDYKYLIRLLTAIQDSPKMWRVWVMNSP